MRSRNLAWWTVAVTMGMALAIPAGAPAGDAPPTARPPAAAPAPAYDAARTGEEREANETGYCEHITGIRQYLLEKHLGKWVAIAGGRAFPVNETRTAVRPAATMEEADAAARAEVPDARHRFVFRIGEEGDLNQGLGGAEVAHVLGNGFLAELDRPDVLMQGIGPGQPIHFVKGGQKTEITVKGPDNRMYVRPEVGAPGATGRADANYVLSTGFGGYAVLPDATAASASLHLWEVPGKITVYGALQKGECRRARARFRVAGTDLDLLRPVAVWPERP